ncbi:MAG TPA: alpha/beta fold hydrolase [Dehalococcoidia bacterium]|nr:alpha/beta fold hydrolase [Dehalococcoidia bacterium]
MNAALRYVTTSDGVSIAFASFGDGPPVVFASNIFGDLALGHIPWQMARATTDGLVARGWRVVRYDVRGMGASDRERSDAGLEGRVRDLEAVIHALGLERFALAGVDEGAATALAFAAIHPRKVTQLVLLSPWLRGSDRYSIPGARFAAGIAPTDRPDWRFFMNALSSIATDFGSGIQARELAAAMEEATTPEALAVHRRASVEINLASYLARLNFPVLVVHDPHFAFGSLELAREVADGIPGAIFTVIDENSIAGEQHEQNVAAIDEFLLTGKLNPAPGTVDGSGARPAKGHLTVRETEVLGLLASGLSNKEIAALLTLAVTTVERHLVNVYAKIGARGRADATAYALRHGLGARGRAPSTGFP